MKMTVYDFVKKADCSSDDIPVEVRDRDSNLIATGKSLWDYPSHCGLEIERPLHSVTVRRDAIVLRIK